jgi:hypothetical protein
MNIKIFYNQNKKINYQFKIFLHYHKFLDTIDIKN